LLAECLEGLNIQPGGTYVDVTYGGGGHSRAILERIGPEGTLIAFDQDPDARQNLVDDPRLIFVPNNFRYLRNYLAYYEIETVDGILADLGISSHHVDAPERGFSFRSKAPMDMRMDKQSELSAIGVFNTYSEERLADIFFNYGELTQSRRLAAALCTFRKGNKIETADDVKKALQLMLFKGFENKLFPQLFQAVRIEVNGELDALRNLLEQGMEALAPGGRMAIMSYHSLEDRLVKQFFKSGTFVAEEPDAQVLMYGKQEGPLSAVNRKVIIPSPEEQAANPRSRSAKLRVAEKNA
jgi:16S rRNA (cytosine1402-N4)-methyltransferase